MSEFVRGQRVRCVVADGSLGHLVKGRVYTVDSVAVCRVLKRVMLVLWELPGEDWFVTRFELVGEIE